MDVSRIYRLLRLVTLLQGDQSFTAADLAEELQVSRRTIFRDLNALEMAHVPYYYDPASRSYRISQHFFLQPVNLTLGESLALLALAGRLERDTNIPLLGQAAQAAAKIESVLPDSVRRHVGSVVDRLSLRLGPLAAHEGSDKFFDMLSGAIIHRRICRMVYESFHEQQTLELTVHPLRLVFIQRAWYLLAWVPEHTEVRTFKLIRIRELSVSGRTFEKDKDIQPEDYFGKAWLMIPEGRLYKVRLRFTPKVAGNVAEVRWHSTQQIEWNDDGSMEFRVEVDGLREITWWILGYGDQVKVLDPPELAGRIADVARSMLDSYTP